MTIIITVRCDGRGCTKELALQEDYYSGEELQDYMWSHDKLNDFHYCSSCVRKLVKNGELEQPEAVL